MPIKRIGKFLETSDLGIAHSLGIETSQLEHCVREIKTRRILGAFGCPVFGFNQDNLDFLRELPFLKQVWFWDIKLKDISGLCSLAELEYFGVHEKRPAIDFSKFPRLQKIVWYPVRNDSGFEKLSELRELDIWRFKTKDRLYDGIELPVGLKRLDLNWCNPTSLKGLPLLLDLEELQIHYCRNLESIASITECAPNLKRLVITRCANLSDFKVVQDYELERLFINIKGKTFADKTNNTFA